ncbi:putative lipoprotein [hydrothermal vent metagenome]|uniref:Putative lipoprotein n=1 Tax=hydrothermal vent metagenome TaxID=652676 RepID=A0A3B0WEZ0_9ZZZZ
MGSNLMKGFFFFIAVTMLTACSSMGVEPWERDLLAKDSMQPVPNYFDNYFDEHIYFSKEASSGGQGVGGGGCGCN